MEYKFDKKSGKLPDFVLGNKFILSFVDFKMYKIRY